MNSAQVQADAPVPGCPGSGLGGDADVQLREDPRALRVACGAQPRPLGEEASAFLWRAVSCPRQRWVRTPQFADP